MRVLSEASRSMRTMRDCWVRRRFSGRGSGLRVDDAFAIGGVAEPDDLAGAEQFDQRPAGHPDAGSHAQDGDPFRAVRRLVAAGELVGVRPADPQHAGGLLHREQQRVVGEGCFELPNDAHSASYTGVIRLRKSGPSAAFRRNSMYVVHDGQRRYRAVNGGHCDVTKVTLRADAVRLRRGRRRARGTR